jgi:hypothetical protein
LCAQPIADGPRLIASPIIQVALGGAISDSKIDWIAGAGGKGVTYHQNVTAGLHSFDHIRLVCLDVCQCNPI